MNQTLFYANEIIGFGVGKPSPLNSRTSSDNISPHLITTEILFLEPVLGMKMLNDMKAKMNTVPSNYNPNAGALENKFPAYPNYEALFQDYIVPYMGNAFLFHYIPYSTVEIGNAGAQTIRVNNADPASPESLNALRAAAQKTTEILKNRLLDFICQNKANYPLFDDKKCPCGCIDGEIKKPRPPMILSVGGKIDY